VGLGGATPRGIVGHVTSILGRLLGEEGGHAALQERGRLDEERKKGKTRYEQGSDII
jgi:hypothetical protein